MIIIFQVIYPRSGPQAARALPGSSEHKVSPNLDKMPFHNKATHVHPTLRLEQLRNANFYHVHISAM